MSDGAPDLPMLNVVVGDMAAGLPFDRRLGVAVPDGDVAAAAQVRLRMPGGFSPELDTAESAWLWHAGWRTDPASVWVVIGFRLPAREAVDERHAKLTSAASALAGGQPAGRPAGAGSPASTPAQCARLRIAVNYRSDLHAAVPGREMAVRCVRQARPGRD